MQLRDNEPEVEIREPTPEEMGDRIPVETFIEEDEDDLEEKYDNDEDDEVLLR